MAYTTIDKPSDYFNTVLYTGNGSTQSITGVGFQPDWIWGKNRSATGSHNVIDSVRGVSKIIYTNLTDAEATDTSSFNAFGSDGFSVGSQSNVNGNGNSIVAWNWKAGTSFTNDASATGIGSIDSTGSVSTDAGFSIISYTGTGSAGTVAHGLGAAPSVLIHKKRTTSAEAWSVFHQSVGITKRMILSSTEAETADASPQPDWNNVLPTSSVFTIGTSPRTNATEDYICYAFAEKQGYSKFGSYTGNGNADGTFVYTGFKPAFTIIKPTSITGDWRMHDNKRNPHNVLTQTLKPNSSGEDGATASGLLDYTSNGFKWRTNSTYSNGSGVSFIYMCFASNPFTTSTGVPATAR